MTKPAFCAECSVQLNRDSVAAGVCGNCGAAAVIEADAVQSESEEGG